MAKIKTLAACAAVLLAAASCTKKAERCHTPAEMLATGPAQRLGYREYRAVRVSEIRCNRFSVLVTDMDGATCGYIMEYNP